MEIVLASNNAHKYEEVARMLTPLGHRVFTQAEAGVYIDPDETGDTFAENARIKALAVQAACPGKAVLADDSGLAVDALGGAPGVHSARYAGAHGRDGDNNQKLLRELRAVPAEQRTARFVCALALLLPDGRLLEVEGSCEGLIGFTESGAGGFGYDPLFYVGGQSFADMSPAGKDALSHRAAALQKLQAVLRQTEGC